MDSQSPMSESERKRHIQNLNLDSSINILRRYPQQYIYFPTSYSKKAIRLLSNGEQATLTIMYKL